MLPALWVVWFQMSCPADGDGSGWLLGEVAVGSDWLLGEEAVEPGLVVAEHKCRLLDHRGG